MAQQWGGGCGEVRGGHDRGRKGLTLAANRGDDEAEHGLGSTQPDATKAEIIHVKKHPRARS